MISKVQTLFTLLYALVLSGCASYKLGSEGTIPFNTIYITPATNQTFIPQAQAALSTSIRDAFIRDGRIQIVAKESEADVVLTTDIADFQHKRGARNSEDTVEAIEFDVNLTTSVSLFDQIDGVYLFQDRRISQRTNAYVNDPYATANGIDTQSYNQAEYQAVPKIARGLGKQIADEVLSTW